MLDHKFKKRTKIIVLLVLSLTYILVVSVFINPLSRTQGISMKPTLYSGDRIIKLNFINGFPKIKRGSIISFKSPYNNKYSFAKRVIGLPGDKIRIEDGRVFLNDEELIEDYIEKDSITRPGYWDSEWEVPEDEVFVLGDNRQKGGSVDSRSYGCVKMSDITGFIIFVYYPVSARWGFLK